MPALPGRGGLNFLYLIVGRGTCGGCEHCRQYGLTHQLRRLIQLRSVSRVALKMKRGK